MTAPGASDKEAAYAALGEELHPYLRRAPDETSLYERVVETLHRLPHFDWTGIYVLAEPGVLVLGPYRGAPTEHVRIPVGRGICGQSAEREETVLVADVTEEGNYLACSLGTRSEIVVPIRVRGSYRSQIDVDSHTVAAFDDLDRRALEELALAMGNRLGEL